MKAKSLKRLEALEAIERARLRALSPLPLISINCSGKGCSINRKEVTLEEAIEAVRRITPQQREQARERNRVMVITIYGPDEQSRRVYKALHPGAKDYGPLSPTPDTSESPS